MQDTKEIFRILHFLFNCLYRAEEHAKIKNVMRYI